MLDSTVERMGESVPGTRRPAPTLIETTFVEKACARLQDGKPLRRRLPEWGRIHIDRQLPFIVVYRLPSDRSDMHTDGLATGEASYLLAPGDRRHFPGVSLLVREVARSLRDAFGAFLILEVWAGSDEEASSDLAPLAPAFRVLRPRLRGISSTVDALDRALRVPSRSAAADPAEGGGSARMPHDRDRGASRLP
jgi:hypothetical protein